MNQIRAIQALNKREIENGVPPEASWHTDYRDTAFVYFGGLPYELSEGDVITIFSQFGEPVFLKLVRDHETGKSKGFGWLKYEDQRSTDLAVDNLGGSEIGGRLVRVDHARYKPRDDDDPGEGKCAWEDIQRKESTEKGGVDTDEETGDEKVVPQRPLLKEERELQLLIENHDDEDPMKQFLVDEKKKEIEEALQRERRKDEKHSSKHKHRRHRSRKDDGVDDDGERHRGKRRHGQDGDRPREGDAKDVGELRTSKKERTPGERGDKVDQDYDRARDRRHRDGNGRDRSDRDGRRRNDGDRSHRYGTSDAQDRDRQKRQDQGTRGDDGNRRDVRPSRSGSPRRLRS